MRCPYLSNSMRPSDPTRLGATCLYSNGGFETLFLIHLCHLFAASASDRHHLARTFGNTVALIWALTINRWRSTRIANRLDPRPRS
jgi:hypothetical protein